MNELSLMLKWLRHLKNIRKPTTTTKKPCPCTIYLPIVLWISPQTWIKSSSISVTVISNYIFLIWLTNNPIGINHLGLLLQFVPRRKSIELKWRHDLWTRGGAASSLHITNKLRLYFMAVSVMEALNWKEIYEHVNLLERFQITMCHLVRLIIPVLELRSSYCDRNQGVSKWLTD